MTRESSLRTPLTDSDWAEGSKQRLMQLRSSAWRVVRTRVSPTWRVRIGGAIAGDPPLVTPYQRSRQGRCH